MNSSQPPLETASELSSLPVAVPSDVTLIHDSGRGRAVVVLREAGTYSELVTTLTEGAEVPGRLLILETGKIHADSWESLVAGCKAVLTEAKVRQMIPVALGPASVLGIQLTLDQPKAVRQLVLVDAESRPPASLLDKCFSAIERRLPMGLPFRSNQKGFDAGSFLQRLRCPVLVLTTPRSSERLKQEAHFFEERVPTVWVSSLKATGDFLDLFLTFLEKPAKCSQKNMVSGR